MDRGMSPSFTVGRKGTNTTGAVLETRATYGRLNKPVINDLHPTMKPVQLAVRAIANSSMAGAAVLDAFEGSGDYGHSGGKDRPPCASD
jgi:DNA modification methylase